MQKKHAPRPTVRELIGETVPAKRRLPDQYYVKRTHLPCSHPLELTEQPDGSVIATKTCGKHTVVWQNGYLCQQHDEQVFARPKRPKSHPTPFAEALHILETDLRNHRPTDLDLRLLRTKTLRTVTNNELSLYFKLADEAYEEDEE